MSNPKDRDTPVVGPDKNARLRPRVDDQLTTKKAVDDWTSINGPLRPNSEEGINTRFAKVVGVEKDPANFDMNHHAEMVDALSGQPPIRYKLLPQGAAGQIFVPPEGFGGNTPEDKIVNESLPDFGLNDAKIPALNVGDTVAVDYANSSTKQGGFITSKVSKYSDGSGTLREKRKKITSPSTNFSDKKPVTNAKAKAQVKKPNSSKPPPTPKTEYNPVFLSFNILQKIFNKTPANILKVYSSSITQNLKTYKYNSTVKDYNFNTYGSTALVLAAVKTVTGDLQVIYSQREAENVNSVGALFGSNKRFYGRGFMWPFVRGETEYKTLSNNLGIDLIQDQKNDGFFKGVGKVLQAPWAAVLGQKTAADFLVSTPFLTVVSGYDYLSRKNFKIYGDTFNREAAASVLKLQKNEYNYYISECKRIYDIMVENDNILTY